MPGDIHVLSANTELVSRLGSAIGAAVQGNGSSYAVSRVDRMAPGATPVLIVVDLDSAAGNIFQQIRQFRSDGGRTWLAVTSSTASAEQLLEAMRAGANDFLRPDAAAAEFGDVLRRATGALPAQPARPQTSSGLTLAVFSNKGGVGTTTIAINVASSLARRTSRSAVLVDLVFQHGDIATLLDVPMTHTIAQLSRELDRADESYLKSVVCRHASGLYVLPAPASADEAEAVTAAHVGRLLSTLRKVFEFVIVDLGNEFSDQTLTALDAAERILLVTLPDVHSIRNTRRGLELFERLRYDPAKIVLTVNRADAHGRMQQDTMETALGRPIQWSVPNDYAAVVQAVSQGTVIRSSVRGKRLAENLDLLVETHFRRGPAALPPPPALKPARRLWQLVGVRRHGSS